MFQGTIGYLQFTVKEKETMNLGERIFQLRTQLELSQNDLAEMESRPPLDLNRRSGRIGNKMTGRDRYEA